jgi:hypothetical protein
MVESEAIEHMSFYPVSALSLRHKSSTTLKVACGLCLGRALIVAENPVFEMASKSCPADANKSRCLGLGKLTSAEPADTIQVDQNLFALVRHRRVI